MLRRTCMFFVGLDKTTTAAKAVSDMKDGNELVFGGFGCAGLPYGIIQAIRKTGVKILTTYSDGSGIENFGLCMMVKDKQIRRFCCSYLASNPLVTKPYLEGEIELEMMPMGTLAERMRSGGAGIPAFYTATGYNTQRQTGGMIEKYNKDGTPAIISEPKETRNFNNRWYVLEETIRPDFSIIKAKKADKSGNLVFEGAARNFNVPAAKCGKICIAEVEEVVENGEIHPDDVHLPGVYVNRVVHIPRYEIPIMFPKVSGGHNENTVNPNDSRQLIARRAALEFRDGMYVNLGTGMPMSAANYIPDGVSVTIQSENGILGIGPYPTEDKIHPDWINAGMQTITVLPGASCFDLSEAFGQIRGGHMDLTMLGSLEVAANGDLANWGIPGKLIKGPGGAMDLVGSGCPVVVLMTHVNKNGGPKILEQCTYPLTGHHCVNRIITEKAVFDIVDGRLVLKEIAEGLTVDDIKKCTGAPFEVDNVQPMRYADPK